MRGLRLLLPVAAAAFCLACSREQAPPPAPQARPAPAPAPAAEPQLPPGHPVPGAAPASQPGQPVTLSGTLTLGPAVAGKVPEGASLFLMVRAVGGGLLAAKKIEKPAFPLAYTLGSGDVMSHGGALSGKVVVSARLDSDGDAMTKSQGDLVGAYRENPVDLAAGDVKGVDFEIATAVP